MDTPFRHRIALRPDGRRSLTLDAFKDWMRTQPPTRFAGWRGAPAALLLAGLAALMLWSATLSLQPEAGAISTSNDLTQTDAELYRAIIARIDAGEGYYPAVVAEQRLRNYPLRPVVTVRLPTLATFESLTGPIGALVILDALAFLALILLVRRLATEVPDRTLLLATAGLAALAILPTLIPIFAIWHEAWAAVFIVLSLACRSRERWLASVLLGLVAVSIRELALPYLCVMAVTAFAEGNRRESAAWAAAIALFSGVLAAHAYTVSTHLVPGDMASPGWVRSGGWIFVVSMLGNSTFLAAFPLPVVSCLAALALLGWTAWPSAFAARGALLMNGYVCVFMLVGRPDNFYWGLLLGPLFLIGLAFAPAALRDLFRAAAPTRFSTPRTA